MMFLASPLMLLLRTVACPPRKFFGDYPLDARSRYGVDRLLVSARLNTVQHVRAISAGLTSRAEWRLNHARHRRLFPHHWHRPNDRIRRQAAELIESIG